MKSKVLVTIFSLMAVLFVSNINLSARSYDGQLIYNPIEENGLMVGQTVYKMGSNGLHNYMKYNYKYDDNKRMIESETMKWDGASNEWANDLRISYLYEGKSVTTTYYKWNKNKNSYILVPEMTVTMDNTNM